ncbi:uncharacterized protein LOC105173330 [Sesamum indicum]|uniref:Uncharacterized protein LOC105173330 n=1 Tax=Sesamum indicum TaxID=4182 RepID=A0A6I9U7N0_SESIN|nr:uncharacterized protein LOC105173330 [Sesamum indicum]
MAQKYIDEEEMNAMKDNDWTRDPGRSRGERSREGKQRSEKDCERRGPYVPRYHKYTPLTTTSEKVMTMVEKEGLLQWPGKMRDTPAKKNSHKYCRFHKDKGHNTEDCYQLRDEIERLVRQGYFKHLIDRRAEAGDRSRSRSHERHQRDEVGKSTAQDNPPTKGIIHTISGGPTNGDLMRSRKKYARESKSRYGQQVMHVEKQENIVFGDEDMSADAPDQNDPMVIKMDIANYQVHKGLIDNGSSVDIIFCDVLRKMDLGNVRLKPVQTPLVGFGGSEVVPEGVTELPVSLGEEPKRKTCMVQLLVVDSPFAYNVGIGEVICDQRTARQCYNLAVKQGEAMKNEKRKEEMSQSEEAKRGKMERIEPLEEYKEVKLISENFQKTTRIGSQMTKEMETMMIDFLRNNNDLFAWRPSDFQGINPKVIVHRLNIDSQVKPVKQKKRVFGVKRNRIIEEEVNKLLQAGFVREVQYTTWLSNVVIVPKAAGKWRMCTDYTDLNKACPKDPYPLLRIDLLVDSTARCALFSMMDAYQGYHQIFMTKDDAEKTAFVTEKGVYCYNVMPFRLKNAGATYQRLVNQMFKDHIESTMEVYVDDMLVKSKQEDDHLTNLRTAFDIMLSYGMELNPSKCTFRVRGGKFLGYMVSERGIEANSEKMKAIMQLGSPKSIKEVQQLTGKVASLNRFIARFADRNLPFFKVLRKSNNFEWNEECEQALQELKLYLTTPPLLSNPMIGEKLYVYLAVFDNAVSSVLIREENGKQNPVYYVSKMLQGAEKKYIQIEKLALALVITARKLRPYFQSHPIVVLTNHPLKQVMSKPDTSGRMIKWAVELGEFDIEFQTRNAIKAQVFADFLVEFVGEQPEKEEKWLLHVNGSSTSKNGGAGIYLQGPDGAEIEIAVRLNFPATNNEAEYEALIQGLQTALDGGIRQVGPSAQVQQRR